MKLPFCNKMIAALSLFLSLAFSVHAGTEIQNGGRSEIAEFKLFSSEVFFSFGEKLEIKDIKLNPKDVLKQIKNVTIVCKKDLQIDGEEKDAINYPYQVPQLIELNCEKWSKLNLVKKYLLSVHEVLHLALVNDSQYDFSNEIVRLFFLNKGQTDGLSNKLFGAILECNIDAFEELVAVGANIYYRNSLGYTPFRTAIQSSCFSIFNELDEVGVSYEDDEMLMMSLQYSLASSEHVFCDTGVASCRTLTQNEANLNKLNILKSVLSKNGDIVQLQTTEANFFIAPASPAAKMLMACKKGNSLLHIVAAMGNRELYNSLVSLGFDEKLRNSCMLAPKDLLQLNAHE